MTITADLARALTSLSHEFRRGLSLLLDRRGRVVTVAVGDASDTPLPPVAGEADARLYGLRLVHTHLKPTGLSRDDLTMLFLQRLDAIAAIDVGPEGLPGAAHLAQVAPQTSEEEDWLLDPPMDVHTLERIDLSARIRALEEEMTRSRTSREVTRSSQERAVLIGLETGEGLMEAESRLAELAELAHSAGATVAWTSLQHRRAPDHRTLIGRGKLQELVSKAYHEDADLLIFDRELAPAQAREIEAATNLRVLDRTQLILDIFAQNARGREAQVQVELAQLHYQLPRLAGRGKAMSRLGGGIGTRGPGETKLEVDRRRIRDRLAALESAVDDISRRRAETRKQRNRSSTPVLALVGYTNAGKSTLFNVLAKSDAVSRNKLFATLRPTTREAWLPGLGEWGGKVMITDTVGFIRDLPEELVGAFRATLDELHDADLLLHVVDAAAPGAPDRVEAVDRILDELELESPRAIILNKADGSDPVVLDELRHRYAATAVSALDGSGIDALKDRIVALLTEASAGGEDSASLADLVLTADTEGLAEALTQGR